MIYLKEFSLPTQKTEDDFFSPLNPIFKKKNFRTIYVSKYPFHLFDFREPPVFEMGDITIFCGNNGSGKSTILNVISERLRLPRETLYNRSDFFDDYTELCSYKLERDLPKTSCTISSDDVFDKVLDIRRLNNGIDDRRESLIKEFVEARSDDSPNNLLGLDDFDRWQKVHEMKNKHTTQSEYIRRNLIRNVEERSNGESALSYFVDRISDSGLYLLDEPENSLSPQNQLNLKLIIEDSVRNYGCQFIISTHSPFLLSLRKAKIYDLDSVPIKTVRNWTYLESVKVYHDFFKECEDDFL